jgi:hypothetical protein
MVEFEPRNALHKYNFIQCSSCGAVVGTQEFYNIGSTLFDDVHSLDVRFNKVHSQISTLEATIQSLANKIKTSQRKPKKVRSKKSR